ncbi:hypothetical protein ABIE00_005102 [Arthrobacter sp. OAP107]
MLGLPPLPPVTGFAARVRLPRDYYVRMGSNDYSVYPQAIGRFVDVTADLDTVRISLGTGAMMDSAMSRTRAQTLMSSGGTS